MENYFHQDGKREISSVFEHLLCAGLASMWGCVGPCENACRGRLKWNNDARSRIWCTITALSIGADIWPIYQPCTRYCTNGIIQSGNGEIAEDITSWALNDPKLLKYNLIFKVSKFDKNPKENLNQSGNLHVLIHYKIKPLLNTILLSNRLKCLWGVGLTKKLSNFSWLFILILVTWQYVSFWHTLFYFIIYYTITFNHKFTQ